MCKHNSLLGGEGVESLELFPYQDRFKEVNNNVDTEDVL